MHEPEQLTSLPYRSLAQLKEQIEKILPAKLADTKAEFRSRMIAEAEALGLDPAEFIIDAARTKRERVPTPIKYRNPERLDQTWSGKGKTPNWLKAKLAAGESIDSFKLPAA